MAADNTLGSPTEGLGANITFSGGDRRQPAQMRVGEAQQVRLGNSTKISLQTPVVGLGNMANDNDPTLDLVMKVAGAVVGPALKKYQTEQYVAGMQRAASGAAVKDIVDEQPWYSRIFGDSDVVEGARAYTQQAKATETAMLMTENMQELRKLDGASAQAHFTDIMMRAQTGDAATDSALMRSLSGTMPAVMKQQAKEHYGYLQEEASKSESAAIQAAAKRLQDSTLALKEGKISQDDFDALKGDLAWLNVPANGRDPESAAAQRTSDLVMMAEKGQFHALNTLEELGMVNMLSTDQQTRYAKAREQNEVQWRAQNSAPYIERIASLTRLSERGVAGWTGNDMIGAVKDLNKDYREQTGSGRELFDPQVVSQYGERFTQAVQATIDAELRANAAAAEKAAASGDKAGEAAFQRSAILQAWNAGDPLGATLQPGISKEKVDDAIAQNFLPQFQKPSMLEPATVRKLSDAAVMGYVNPAIKRQVGAWVNIGTRGGSPNAGFADAFSLWSKMQQAGAAAAYFDDKDHNRFLEFSLLHPDPIDPAAPTAQALAAFDVSFGPGAKSGRAKLDKKEVAAATSELKSEFTNWWPETLGGNRDILPNQLKRLSDAVVPMAELYGRLHSPKDATRLGIQSALKGGHQIVGGYYIRDPESPRLVARLQQELYAQRVDFSLPTGDEFGEYVGDIFDETLNAAGGKGADPVVTVHNGTINFTFVKDEKQLNARLTYGQLANAVMKRAAKRRPQRGSTKPMTDTLTFVPDGFAP